MKPSVCAQLEPDLTAVAAGEADPTAERRVGDHVATCGSCRALLSAYRELHAATATLREQPIAETHLVRARERLDAGLADLRTRIARYVVFRSPLGDVFVACTELGVVFVEYLSGRSTSHATEVLQSGGLEPVAGERDLARVQESFLAYLEGRTKVFTHPVDMRLVRTPFQRAVLEATASIPYGAVVSYKRLAHDIGRPEAVRAVAQALRHNPVAIAIPCHRVVGVEGALVGYAGGKTELKKRLLSTEGLQIGKASGDYVIARDSMYVLSPGESEYCLPSCASPQTLRSGLLTLFASRDRAEAAGFAPCTTCRPDLHPLDLWGTR